LFDTGLINFKAMKKNHLSKIIFGTLLMLQWGAMAQTQINAKVEGFTLTNLLDNKPLSLNGLSETSLVVLVFTSAHCPYSKSYQTRLLKLAQKAESEKQAVKFIFINPETTQDTPEMMQENAKVYNLPYLLDKNQEVTAKLGAIKTPEVFVLEQSSGQFFLKYHGAIDDNPQVAEDVSQKYLEMAIQSLLNKQNLEITNSKPTGCMIKKQ
jgi:thiol-disulfide isomerase/thioredoxin